MNQQEKITAKAYHHATGLYRVEAYRGGRKIGHIMMAKKEEADKMVNMIISGEAKI